MGLAILRALIEAHGGSITFDEAHEGGAAFRVVLPSATTA
jgi:signal transduction histidine kinase